MIDGEGGKELARFLVGNLNEKRYYVMKRAAEIASMRSEKVALDNVPTKADDLLDDGKEPAKPTAGNLPPGLKLPPNFKMPAKPPG